MIKFPAKLHTLWESHELHMEVAVLGLALTLLSALVLLPGNSPQPTSIDSLTEGSSPVVEVPTENTQADVRPSVRPGYFVTTPDTSLERAQIDQNITKTNYEITEIQKSSLAITALIQKECGGQTNDCAKKLQASLEENAREYDRAQERLRALTASLGNLE